MGPSAILPYFQVASYVAIVVGGSIAIYEFVQSRRRQRGEAALAVVTGLQTQAFRDAFALVNELPIAAPPEQVRSGGLEMERAVGTVMMTFESLGVMVHNRLVPVDLVDQVIGGFLRESWRRLEPYVLWKRKALGYARWGEWYQWLFQHLAADPRREVGAYEAFKDWRPEPYKVWLRRR